MNSVTHKKMNTIFPVNYNFSVKNTMTQNVEMKHSSFEFHVFTTPFQL